MSPDRKIISTLGIHLIEIPNPYSTWTSNAYFVGGTMPTLIDTGIGSQEAYEALSAALSEIGHTIENIDRIILTHGHADHRELAARIGKESGAQIIFHPLEAGKVLRDSTGDGGSKGGWIEIFKSMGVPDEEVPGLVEGPKTARIDPEVSVTSKVDEGDKIEFGDFCLNVLHTPGHSSGSICLYDEGSGILFSGDTVLMGSHVTPLLEMDMMCADPTYNGLKLHMESLRRLVDLSPSSVLPGHGEMFCELKQIVDGLFERHSKRRRHILRSLRNGPRSLYQICKSTFLFESVDALYLLLSEVSGNIEMLIDESKVVKTQKGDVVYYEKA
jgi:glyoxylase-like metal-dependent hydrolase (beta-lactamase superfamily II)